MQLMCNKTAVPNKSQRIPVTVITGFLGSGKTTLLNRILSEQHGHRIAVIENEFGEIGIDQALVINADEEVFEMSNGCICCTVRGDLIRVLGNLNKRRDKFERVIVETTGLANPGPVAQTFFVDDEVSENYVLDGIITVVDAKHLMLHLHDSVEAQEQVGFADVLIFNKCDLVDPSELAVLQAIVAARNPMARVFVAEYGNVPLQDVLDIGGFDLRRALELRPAFLAPEYPFEWGGQYMLAPGTYDLHVGHGPDASIDICVVGGAECALTVAAERVFRTFSEPPQGITVQPIVVGEQPRVYRVPNPAPDQHVTIRWSLPTAGSLMMFTQHRPEEFALALWQNGLPLAPRAQHEFAPQHTHEEAVSSVAFSFDGAFDEGVLNAFFSKLLREQGAHIYRMKGILNIAGHDRRYVFQAVHMLFDGKPDSVWPPGSRTSQVVFIGKQLDRAKLYQGLQQCLR